MIVKKISPKAKSIEYVFYLCGMNLNKTILSLVLLVAFLLNFLHTIVPHHHHFDNKLVEQTNLVAPEIAHQHQHNCDDLFCLLDCFLSKINHQENYNSELVAVASTKINFVAVVFNFLKTEFSIFKTESSTKNNLFPQTIAINNPVFIAHVPHRGPPSFLA